MAGISASRWLQGSIAAATGRTGAARSEAALWVFFDPAAASSNAPPALGPEALDARARSGIEILPGDRPLPPHLIQAVAATGAQIRHVSRWLRAVSVTADPVTATRLGALPGVTRVQPVGVMHEAALWGAVEPVALDTPSMRITMASADGGAQGVDSVQYGPNWGALREIGIANAHRFGFTGKGVRIAILDTGFETRHQSLEARQIVRTRDFINNDTIVYDQPGDTGGPLQARHGTQVWSLLGGYAPGTLIGPAYDAEFVLAKVDQEPNDTRADEDRWVAAVEWADSLGARIIHSSVVFRFDFVDRPATPYALLNGDDLVTTRAADEAARRGILVVTAIGDNGPGLGSLSSPADADSVISVGAILPNGQVANFSARGPTADNRTKPELVARGTGLIAASSATPLAYDIVLAGTSYSAPLVTGSAALLLEAWRDLSPMAVREALILSATQPRLPDNALGYGLPDAASAILFPRGLTPAGVSSIDLVQMLTTLAPTFSWNAPLVHPSMTPVLYRVEVATDSLFSNIVFADTTRAASSLVARRPLAPSPALWWRVTGVGQLGVSRVSRPMGPFGMPGWVRLVSPDPGQVTFVETPRPDLTWVPLTAPAPIGPLAYDVEILSNQTGRPVQPTIRNLTTSTVRVPQPLNPNESYRWRVIVRSPLGLADTVESKSAFVVVSTDLPPITLLQQNFPNPFPRPDLGHSETRIWFDIAETAAVELAVFDLRGRLIKQLVPASPGCGAVTLQPGHYGRIGTVAQEDPCVGTTWDGTDHAGRRVARGVYVLRLRVNGQDHFRRMVFLPD